MRSSCYGTEDVLMFARSVLSYYAQHLREGYLMHAACNMEREFNQSLYVLVALGNDFDRKHAVDAALLGRCHVHPLVAGRFCDADSDFGCFVSNGWHESDLDSEIYSDLGSCVNLALSGIDIVAPIGFHTDGTKSDFLEALTAVYDVFDKVRDMSPAPESVVIAECYRIDAYLCEKIRRDTVGANIYDIDAAAAHMNDVWARESY